MHARAMSLAAAQRRLVVWLVGALLLLGSGPEAAAQQAVQDAAKLEWTRVRGTAIELGISANGIVFAADRDNNLWRWLGEGGMGWRLLPLRIGRVAPEPQGKPWAIATNGHVYFYNGLWWEQRGDVIANDIGVSGKNGEVFILTRAGSLARWQTKGDGGAWENLGGRALRRIAVDDVGRPWIIEQSGAIVRHENGAFVELPGRARDIALSPEGVAFIVTTDGSVARWNTEANDWDTLPGIIGAAVIAAGPGARPWIATADGTIYATSDFRPPEKGPAPGQISLEQRQQYIASEIATVTDPAPFEFVLVRGTGRDVGIGREGSVFLTGTDGQLMRWSNAEKMFLRFTGGLNRVAVSPAGQPWGVSAQGQVFRHDGQNWVQVPNITGARDLSIGADGSVFVVTTDGRLLKFEVERNQFTDTRITRVASVGVTPRGEPWIVRDDGALMSCQSLPCQRVGPTRPLQRVDIGPDGSVFVIDTSTVLWRFAQKEQTFERIRGIVAGAGVAEVAVGPRGRPWIVDTNSRIYATTFFSRDETQDEATSQRTSQLTAPAEPAVTFSRLMRFRKVTTNTYQYRDISIGRDGTVYMLTGGLIQTSRYNTRSKAFEPKIYAPVDVASGCTPLTAVNTVGISTATANELWQSGYQGSWCSILKRTPGPSPSEALRKCESKFYVIPAVPGGCNTFFRVPRVSVGADGSVFYASYDGLLYQFNAKTDSFGLLSSKPIVTNVDKVATDPQGVPWIIDMTGKVRQFNGVSFFDRPRNLAQRAKAIGIGANGSVYVVDLNGFLKRYNATNDAFDRINGVTSVEKVAVAPDGLPWVITTAGDVMQPIR